MKVSDIMNKYPVSVEKTTRIEDVVHLLVKHNLTAIPVVTKDNIVIGIISEGDLLYKKIKPHAPHYVNILGASIYYNGIGEYNEQFKKLLATEVVDLMNQDVITTKPDTDVEEIVAVMVDQHLKNLPVVNRDGKLVGMLSRHDIMKLIATEG